MSTSNRTKCLALVVCQKNTIDIIPYWKTVLAISVFKDTYSIVLVHEGLEVILQLFFVVSN